MALNLNNIMLGTEDSKRLADFYAKVLGAPNPDWSDEANGWFGFQAGEGTLAIGPHGGGKHPDERERELRVFGIHLEQATEDVQ